MAVESLAGTCKSVLLGIALFKVSADKAEYPCAILVHACLPLMIDPGGMQGRLGVQEGTTMARLEEELQLEDWGYVEGGHDIDDADIRVRLGAASIFARLLKDRKPSKGSEAAAG